MRTVIRFPRFLNTAPVVPLYEDRSANMTPEQLLIKPTYSLSIYWTI
jgi:hypothetical protein